MVQDQKSDGEGEHIDHGTHGHGFADLNIAPDGQRHIDQQAQIAHGNARDVLDHGADTVQTRRGELVGKNEQLIVDGGNQSQSGNDQIGKRLFRSTHNAKLLWISADLVVS